MKRNLFKTSASISSFKGYIKYWPLSIMLLPVIAYFVIFHYVPMYGIVLAFKKFDLSKGILGSPWVGLDNFKTLMGTSTFLRAFRNTVIISGLKLLCGFPMPIILALLLNELKNLRFKKVVQTVSYLPYFLSWVILAGLFIQFLSPSNGVVNYILGLLGIKPIFFMADNNWFRTVLIITDVWKGMGWGSIIYLAAITGINPELYEAAECDGAKRHHKIWYVTLPLLAPTISVLFILNVGGIMSAGFDQIFNMYTTAVYETSDIIDTYVYRYGLGKMQFSLATAVGLFKNVIGFALVIITNALSKRISDNGIW
jgi:putative aldouronate transport system permease protein